MIIANESNELIIATKKLIFQNEEIEKRAAELIIANKELAFQNEEKEKRAAELIIANKELVFQNEEKEKRAAELIIANKELAFQNEEKEKRAAELIIANKELLAFTYVSSHDLQEPLRKIQTFVTIILDKENENLSENGKYNFQRIQLAAGRMRQLIEDLLAFSRISTTEHRFEKTDLNIIIEEVKADLKETILEKKAVIEVAELCSADIIFFQFRQLMSNLISNALKFSQPGIPPHILITSKIVKGSKLNHEKLSPEKNYCHITIKDNGIGFEPHFSLRIFEVFQRLHSKEEYAGTGIGLAIVKKIVENHNGIITAKSELNNGATFDIYIPAS
jgi:light-regulated signal transduction histidine kinase (bacteriophytochrome)